MNTRILLGLALALVTPLPTRAQVGGPYEKQPLYDASSYQKEGIAHVKEGRHKQAVEPFVG